MRLDKLLSVTATATRKETARAVRAGEIAVNGVTVKRADLSVDPERDTVSFRGKIVQYKQYRYILLNKPDGYVSATEDGRDPTVLDLLPPELAAQGLFPCGRLDKHTLGLMLLTNNGTLAHRLLAPRRHVAKRYRFCAKFPLTDEECARFRAGLVLEDGYETKPADIVLDDAHSGVIRWWRGNTTRSSACSKRSTIRSRIWSASPLALSPSPTTLCAARGASSPPRRSRYFWPPQNDRFTP